MANFAWSFTCSLVLPLLMACGGQMENRDDQDWTKSHGIQSGAWREVETLFDGDDSDVDRYKRSPQGVRHDLSMSPQAKPDGRCSCVDVVFGQPGEAKFEWAGQRPSVSAKHMALAIRSDGSQCTASKGLRPSIRAVDRRGKDVVVVIEELPLERPQALGAVIRKPAHDGALFIRSAKYRGRSLPYARSNAAHRMCKVPTDPRAHHLHHRSGRRF